MGEEGKRESGKKTRKGKGAGVRMQRKRKREKDGSREKLQCIKMRTAEKCWGIAT